MLDRPEHSIKVGVAGSVTGGLKGVVTSTLFFYLWSGGRKGLLIGYVGLVNSPERLGAGGSLASGMDTCDSGNIEVQSMNPEG